MSNSSKHSLDEAMPDLEEGKPSQDLQSGDTPSDTPANEQKTEPDHDPNLVDFDGPEDQANPKNWSFHRKWACTGLVSLITFMSPMTSSMIAPAETAIAESFHITSTFTLQLIFAIFLLGFIIGPLFLSPLSELYGRVIVLQLANAFFLVFNLVAGFSQNTGEMIAFRLLSGFGAAAPQTVGGGVLSDMWAAEQRGKAVALYTLAPLLGPSLGPLIGAWIAEKSTWRWCFWSVTIFGVAVQALIALFMRETYPPRILELKARRLRKETGNNALHTRFEGPDKTHSQVFRRAIVRVFIMLATQPIMQFLSIFFALLYGTIYLILSVFPQVWTKFYNESIGISGLNYVSLLIGMTAGAQLNGLTIDVLYRRLKERGTKRQGGPEFRIPMLFPSTFITSVGMILFGWTAQYRVQWIVPNIGIALFGLGTTVTFTSIQTYVIDAYPTYAASAIGATAVVRSAAGFGFPLFADAMFDAINYGWGCTLLALVMLVVGFTGSAVLWFYGSELRQRSPYASG